MKLVIPLLVALLSCQAVSAEEVTSHEGSAPGVEAQADLLVAPARHRVRSRKIATLSLLGGGLALTLSGGLLIGLHNQSDGKLDSGIAFTALGGAAVLATIYLGTVTAGRDAGVESVRRLASVPVTDRLMLMDELETDARHATWVGLGLLLGGTVLFAAGTAMALVGLGNPFEANSGNNGMFLAGTCISVAGDAAWFTGSFTLSYYGGKVGGIRDARRSLAFAPTGVAGTF